MRARAPQRSQHAADRLPATAVGGGSAATCVSDLTGRVVLVTGASRGLGAAMSRALAEAGASLVLWGRSAKRLEHHAATLRLPPSRLLTQPVDVTRQADVRGAITKVLRRFARIDVLVNNAGIWDGDEALTLTRRQWNRVVETENLLWRKFS